MSQPSESLGWPGRLWETHALAAMATRDPLDLTEAGRLRRLEALDELLSTLTGVLDVRDVFVRISEIAQRVLPHDFMTLPLVCEDREHVVIYASGGAVVPEVPPRIRIPDPAVLVRQWDHRIIPDILEDPYERDQTPARVGLRSLLRLAR
jgi:hypothetical protein